MEHLCKAQQGLSVVCFLYRTISPERISISRSLSWDQGHGTKVQPSMGFPLRNEQYLIHGDNVTMAEYKASQIKP